MLKNEECPALHVEQKHMRILRSEPQTQPQKLKTIHA
jgi:hypothetical protein